MPANHNKFSQFWQELKRRRVVHVITVYASAVFVSIELISNLAEPLNLPPNLLTIIVIVLAVGFPLAIILSWHYDKAFEAGKFMMANDLLSSEKDAIKEIERIFSEHGFIAAYEALLQQLEIVAQGEYINPIDLAMRYFWLKNNDKTMYWLERGFEYRDQYMPYIATGIYQFDSLYDNPRFLDIVEKMNLPLPEK